MIKGIIIGWFVGMIIGCAVTVFVCLLFHLHQPASIIVGFLMGVIGASVGMVCGVLVFDRDSEI
jgi:hypothetical protein